MLPASNVPPFGLRGGRGGVSAEILRDGKVLTRAEKVEVASALPLTDVDMTVGFETAAGGGYGSPLERPLDSVQADVRDGLVSLAHAETVYGVILDSESLQLDRSASEAKRRELTNGG